MLPAWWVALLTAVWSIYTTDHLLDAFRVPGPLATHRHSFHRLHAKALSFTLALALLAGLIASFELRPPVRILGLALLALVVVYLASAQGLLLPSLPKEVMAGLLYAAGIWGGPLIMSDGLTSARLGAASLHALAAVLNLAVLGVFEADVDQKLGSRSLGLRWGLSAVRKGAVAASVVGCLTATVAASLGPHQTRGAFLVLGIQVALPAMMLLGSRWSARHERYRIWGDSVFLLGAAPRLLA